MDPQERNDRFTKLEERFKGYEVYDPQGERIGTADDLFINENDQPEYIRMKMGLLGMLGMRSTLIPIGVCTVDEVRRVIEVSEHKDRVKDAPSFDGGDITPDYENTVRSHFGLEGSHISRDRGSYGPSYPSDRVEEDYAAGERTGFGMGEREEYRERPGAAAQADTAATAESRAITGTIRIEDIVVAKMAGIAAQEVDGVQMGRGAARAVGGFVNSVGGAGGGSLTRGVSAEVSEDETSIHLDMAIDYGKSVPQVTEAVRRNVINRVENWLGLRVKEVNISVNDLLLP